MMFLYVGITCLSLIKECSIFEEKTTDSLKGDQELSERS